MAPATIMPPTGITTRAWAAMTPRRSSTPSVAAVPASQSHNDRLHNARSAGTTTLRSHAQVIRFFDGLELLEPGLVQVHRWQPGWAVPNGEQIAAYAGLARKP
jgi:hypothetical protein